MKEIVGGAERNRLVKTALAVCLVISLGVAPTYAFADGSEDISPIAWLQKLFGIETHQYLGKSITKDTASSSETVKVSFLSHGDTVYELDMARGGSIVMPDAPEGVSHEHTVWLYIEDGHQRCTMSEEEAMLHEGAEAHSIRYEFLGWSDSEDYGLLSTDKQYYDTLQSSHLHKAKERVRCPRLYEDGDSTEMYAVWKQVEGPYYAGESIDIKENGRGGNGAYRVSMTLLYNADRIPAEPSVLSVGYPVKPAGWSDTEKYFSILYRDVVGNTDGTNDRNQSVGKWNPLDRKLTLDELIECAVTTIGEDEVNANLTDGFWGIVNDINMNDDGTWNYWDPETERVLWYVVKEQKESYSGNDDSCYIGWHFDGMVVEKHDVEDAESVSYTLKYNGNCSDYSGTLPLGTINKAIKNDDGVFMATDTVADPSDEVYVATNASGEHTYASGITRHGHTFIGWASSPVPGEGETIYQPGDEITLTGNATLYAQWKGDPSAYVANHYQQQADGTYMCVESDTVDAFVDDEVTVTPKEYALYSYDAEGSTATGIVLDNEVGDKLVLNLFYDRKSIPITVTAGSAEKTYDGEPLYAPEEVDVVGDVPDGFTVNVTVSGEQTEVGESESLVTSVGISDAEGEDVTEFFVITKVPGVLKVIEAGEVEKKMFSVDPIEDVVYNAEDQLFVPVVKDEDGNELVEGDDYDLEYTTDDLKNVGTVCMNVTGVGDYEGIVNIEYAITPAPAKVIVADAAKTYLEDDPEFAGEVEGMLSDDEPGILVYYRSDEDERAGEYEGILTVNTDEANPNYAFEIEPGNFTIFQKEGEPAKPVINVKFEGGYNGEPFKVIVGTDDDNSVPVFRFKGDEEWDEEVPPMVDAGEYDVETKVINDNYTMPDSEAVKSHVSIDKADAVLMVHDKEKMVGEDDPELTGEVMGLHGDDELGRISYFRANPDINEPGEYEDELLAKVEDENGNYRYVTVSGKFIIKEKGVDPTGTPIEDDSDSDDPVSDGPDTIQTGFVQNPLAPTYDPSQEAKPSQIGGSIMQTGDANMVFQLMLIALGAVACGVAFEVRQRCK